MKKFLLVILVVSLLSGFSPVRANAYLIGMPLGENVDVPIFADPKSVTQQAIEVNGFKGENYSYITDESIEKMFSFYKSCLAGNGWSLVNEDIKKGLAVYNKDIYAISFNIVSINMENGQKNQVFITFLAGDKNKAAADYDPFKPFENILPRYPNGNVISANSSFKGNYAVIVIRTKDSFSKISSFYVHSLRGMGFRKTDEKLFKDIFSGEDAISLEDLNISKYLDAALQDKLIKEAKYLRFIKDKKIECFVLIFQNPNNDDKTDERFVAINYKTDEKVLP